MSYFHINDTMMRSVSFADVSLMLRNTRPEDRGRFKHEVKRMLMDCVDDAMYDMEEHWDEICADAFPDDDEKSLVNASGWDSERLEKLAWEIHEHLRKHEMWVDIYIYYDGKRMGTSSEADGKSVYRYNGEPFIEEGYDPRDYFPYVQNPHILSMSFEGSFYNVMNYSGGEVLDGFDQLLAKHGLTFELGHAWNLTLMEV